MVEEQIKQLFLQCLKGYNEVMFVLRSTSVNCLTMKILVGITINVKYQDNLKYKQKQRQIHRERDNFLMTENEKS